ncbi:MAG: cytochrome c [Deltaproteobacteria bacterium]|nr:cytochrome c [Deltaproteobacteria bacterium]
MLRTAFMRRVVVGGALLLAPGGVAALGGCEVPTPLAPAEPIGTFPAWGAEFATPAQQPQSALGAGMGGAPGAATSSTGQAMPGAIKSFSDGDAGLGKGVYQALCARCHGAAGEGGALPGNVAVPALADAGLQGRLDDASMARSIALGKGAMPSFRTELNRDQLAGVIAYVRTLKR